MSEVARISRPEREDDAEVTLAFDDNRRASLLFGQYDQNLVKLERRLRVACVAMIARTCAVERPLRATTRATCTDSSQSTSRTRCTRSR